MVSKQVPEITANCSKPKYVCKGNGRHNEIQKSQTSSSLLRSTFSRLLFKFGPRLLFLHLSYLGQHHFSEDGTLGDPAQAPGSLAGARRTSSFLCDQALPFRVCCDCLSSGLLGVGWH